MTITIESIAGARERAVESRRPWLDSLASRGTDCVRLLWGPAEGAPGVTIDRYGPLLLIQTGREPLSDGAPEALAALAGRLLGAELEPVWNHRPAYHRGGFERFHAVSSGVHDAIGHEEGLRFRVDPRHGGLDPLLFLDLRSGR